MRVRSCNGLDGTQRLDLALELDVQHHDLVYVIAVSDVCRSGLHAVGDGDGFYEVHELVARPRIQLEVTVERLLGKAASHLRGARES